MYSFEVLCLQYFVCVSVCLSVVCLCAWLSVVWCFVRSDSTVAVGEINLTATQMRRPWRMAPRRDLRD